jgi:pimeloyl-ACP methyl ester carboxylesterase
MSLLPFAVMIRRFFLTTTLAVLVVPGTAVAAEFQPVFLAVRSRDRVTPVGVKREHPIYNLTGWKRADGRVVHDVFDIGDVIVLDRPTVTAAAGVTRWHFTHDDIEIKAEVAGGRVQYSFMVNKPGQWSVAFAGAPAAALDTVIELFQPLVWNGRRLPEASFLIPDDICSIPGCLVQTAPGTVGIMADPRQFPYEMPNGRNRRFGVTVRNQQGMAQPLVFAPFPGSAEAALTAGESRSFSIVLVDDTRPLTATFEAVARQVCGFRDRRENTLTSLNRAFEAIVDFATGPAGRFDPANRAYSYPDSEGTVKNVSALHPLTLAMVTDDERLFHEQGIPILEYLLSREKFLFALSDETKSSQIPSRRLAGPAMPVSELAALHRITHGTNLYFLACAERLSAVDRTLNIDWVSPGGSWQSDLWLSRATGERTRLDMARTKAENAIAARIDRQPTDFAEAGTGTFFDYMLPPWKELYELWLETRDPRHLAAAHKAARQYAQLVWFYPAVPEDDVVVNERGFAPRRGRPDDPGLVPASRETVPAWRVSEQGLICEGNGTVARLAIYLATHAPLFMRLSHDTADPFLHDIARSAIVGRFAGFPGYHFNTQYSTAQEKADFTSHPLDELKVTTSMHYNHSLPMAALVLDYLFSDAYARSRGAIEFPAEFAEGYAYLGGRVYGKPGRFHDQKNVLPWMPKGLVTTDNVQVNYVAGRGEESLCVALMNQCDRPLEDVAVTIDLSRFARPSGMVVAEVWQDGVKMPATVPVEGGRIHVPIVPHGLTSLVIKGLVPMPTFQNKLWSQPGGGRGTSDLTVAMPCGSARAITLSFGERLSWVYAYVECRASDVKQVRLTIDHGGAVSHHTDDTYPFEFSVPDSPHDQPARVRFEIEDASGTVHRSDFAALSTSASLLDRAVEDQELIKSNGRLADIRNKGPNPYLEGFPPPRPFHEKYEVALVRNAAGLLVKAESEYERADAEVVRFLKSNYIPAIRKTMQLEESAISGVRPAARPAEADLEVHENVTYNVLGERALLLDLYTPKTRPAATLPVVIFVHGGGWLDGSHRTNRPVAMSLAKRGFACIAVEYRLGREARFPAAVWDVKAAVRWVRKNAAAYNLDPAVIIVAGGSAGGNIAGLVGVTNGDPRFEGDGQHRDVSSDVSGVIALDGAIGVVSGNWAAFPDKDPWLYNEAVPLFHMIERNQCPPLLFVKAGRPLSAWIEANIADSHSQHIHFRWPHAFECFDPSKDEIVDVLAGHVRNVATAERLQDSPTP